MRDVEGRRETSKIDEKRIEAIESWTANDLQSRSCKSLTTMGFGSYDESEQDNQQIDADDINAGEGRTTPMHDGDIEFEYDDASSEDLLETYKQLNDQ